MRDFSWKYFTLTGDVESYLLFKEIDQGHTGYGGIDEWDDDDGLGQEDRQAMN